MKYSDYSVILDAGGFLEQDAAWKSEDFGDRWNAIAHLAPVNMLDLGCGPGWMARASATFYIGVDASNACISAARMRSTASFVHADARKLPFPNDSFDLVYSYAFLKHFSTEEMGVLLAEAKRVSRGFLAMGFVIGESKEELWYSPPACRDFIHTTIDRKSLGAVCDGVGLSIVEEKYLYRDPERIEPLVIMRKL